MTYNCNDSTKCPTYPGEYTPLPEKGLIFEKLKMPHSQIREQPAVNMIEFTDYIKIDVMLPGIKREDICVHMRKNIVSVFAVPKTINEQKEMRPSMKEYDNKYLERHILLPENTDTELVSAEFGQGVLRICFPKTESSSAIIDTKEKEIVVY
ncbi:MAG TPA: Hsp20/alpha crystallin family protein [Chitinophagaceae bacterium]|nr:Hsp20/alpha crystallin family protein [Chitinophagaceae bacterium]